jgi:hypothetical protein
MSEYFPSPPSGLDSVMTSGLRTSVAVAKYTPVGHSTIRVHFLDVGDEVREATVTGVSSLFLGATHTIDLEEDGSRRSMELTITPRGNVFDLEVAASGSILAHGMGIVDPEFSNTLLVSWWCGDERPAGIVKYVLGDEPDTIVPTYTSVMLEASGFNDVLGGFAIGSTSDGFPGTYSITYKGEGDTSFGPYEWRIKQRGDVLDLTWDDAGTRAIDGFGFADPESGRSIIVVYWGAGQAG